MENIECVSTTDGIEDEEIQLSHNQFSSAKPHNILFPGLAPTSVHELLECPVCTNSMYPPIHQVIFLFVCLGFVPFPICEIRLFSFFSM